MNEAHDRLEAELAALRPLDASPELRRRIADHRAHSAPSRTRRRWALTVAGGLAAACLVVVILSRWETRPPIVPGPDVVQAPHDPGVEGRDTGPSPLAYRRALARSPDELDALLDKSAVVARVPNPEPVQICTFTHSNATLHALLGED